MKKEKKTLDEVLPKFDAYDKSPNGPLSAKHEQKIKDKNAKIAAAKKKKQEAKNKNKKKNKKNKTEQ